ncbi:MAG TPA: hypothetical protein PKW33_15570 [Anaerolineaceae bacterium]|nr:hypothetical protein [Anaerolineaceae bacterium]HPN53014.1 hypothetical protein [Anaerolineaceae bacterium]
MKQRLTVLTIISMLALAALFVVPVSASPLFQATSTPTVTPTSQAYAQYWYYSYTPSCEASYGSSCTVTLAPCGSNMIASAKVTRNTIVQNNYAQWGIKVEGVEGGTTITWGTWVNYNKNWDNNLYDQYAFGIRPRDLAHKTIYASNSVSLEYYRRDYDSWEGPSGKIGASVEGYCYGNNSGIVETFDNLIVDGDMEFSEDQTPWQEGQYPFVTKYSLNEPYTYGGEKFGRITPLLGFLENMFFNGNPACNQKFQATGPIHGSAFPVSDLFGSDIYQQFTVETTTHIYWKVRARNRQTHFMDAFILGYNPRSTAVVYLTNEQNEKIYLLDSVQLPVESDWQLYTGTLYNLPAGTYILHLSHRIPSSLQLYANGLETVYYDDISIGYTPRSTECDYDEQGEYLPTPSRTPGIVTGTITPVIVTPSRTITPTYTASQIYIKNCDFEQGTDGWIWNAFSNVGYSGGPVKPMYGAAMMSSNTAPISQVITVPSAGGMVYLRTWIRGHPNIYLENTQTSARFYMTPSIIDYPTMASEWTRVNTYRYNIPGGTYKLVLGSTSQLVTTDYDGVAMALNGIPTGACALAGTPTAGPTAAITPTLAPTRTGTLTLLPGTLTPGTPWASQTPGPTRTGTRTVYYVTRTGTITPGGPTVTPGGVFTPIPNWTPGPLTTPAAGFLDCDPPGGLDWLWVGAWFEYERCQAINFVSFQPRHAQTIAALPHVLDDRYPFGPINEVRESIDIVRVMVSAYPWGNQTLPGVNDYTNPIKFITNPQNGPLNGGGLNISLTGGGEGPSMDCSTPLTSVVGETNAGALCFVINLFVSTGIMPWIQLIINLGSIFGVIFYVYERWIAPGMNS